VISAISFIYEKSGLKPITVRNREQRLCG